jgi:voltage-gated potassium channel
MGQRIAGGELAKYQMNERQVEMRRPLDIPVLIAAILTIPVMIIETSTAPPQWKTAALLANWFVWIVFFVDLIAMTSIAHAKTRYMRAAWVDLLIVLTSFPPLTAFGVLRLLRLGRLGPVLRLLRLARLAGVVTRGGSVARNIFGKRGFAYVIVVTFFIVIGFAVAVVLIDPDIDNMGDALWWSVVTITTVGYGDITPDSVGGRIAAGFLMFIGIGVVGVVTGLVASVMLDDTKEEAELHERLDEIEAKLDKLIEKLPEA